MIDHDIDLFRREYARQRKLEAIVAGRKLNRPNISGRQVAALFVGLPFLLFAAVFPCVTYARGPLLKILLSITAAVIVAETYLRLCLAAAVKLYQKRAKEETRRRCMCIPSCSEYALLALKRVFPLARALYKIRKRLYVTCNGDGYKVDFPTKKAGRIFETRLSRPDGKSVK